jgi:hypothetical protein
MYHVTLSDLFDPTKPGWVEMEMNLTGFFEGETPEAALLAALDRAHRGIGLYARCAKVFKMLGQSEGDRSYVLHPNMAWGRNEWTDEDIVFIGQDMNAEALNDD